MFVVINRHAPYKRLVRRWSRLWKWCSL